MSRRPRDIGTAAETAVVRAIRKHGFPHAERRALRGQLDAGDITGTPGVSWEVKGGDAAKTASDGQIEHWLSETEDERARARADVGVLVVQRAGVGPTNARRWHAYLYLGAMDELAHGESARLPVWFESSTDLIPVRLTLADACEVLGRAGYGEPCVGVHS